MRRALAALFAVMLGACRNEAAPAESTKPTIHVLTSLPLVFDEGFGLGPSRHVTATYLRENYTVKPIDLPSQLPDGALLLAAQPRALPAEELVALDAWVRAGGHLLLLADPMLKWRSNRPIGDALRPPVQYADTGLLAHWGLRLDIPDRIPSDEFGLQRSIDIDDHSVSADEPGELTLIGEGKCRLDGARFLARCSIGKGHAAIIADADFLDVGDAEVSPGNGDNLPFLSSELAKMTRGR